MWKYNLEIHWNMDYTNDYLQMDFIITHNATCLFDSSNLWMMKQDVYHKNEYNNE